MSKSDPVADVLMDAVFKSKPLVPSTLNERMDGPGSYVIKLGEDGEPTDEDDEEKPKKRPSRPEIVGGEVVGGVPVTYATAKKPARALDRPTSSPAVTKARIVAATVDGDPVAVLATSVLRQIECAADSLAFFGRNPKIGVLVGDLRGILGEASEALGEILQESTGQNGQT